jgi:dephospho-CoA kinase
MHTPTPLVIAVVGMSGAGKTEAGEFFRKKGFSVIRFGSVVDDWIKEEGLEWSPENTKIFRERIRKELGMAGVAIRIYPKIQEILEKEGKVILDGLYSWEEYVYLKEKLPQLQLLCIYASPSVRYEHLAKRKERPFSENEARERDVHEIEVINKAGPIAIADYLIKNETTMEYLTAELDHYYQNILMK